MLKKSLIVLSFIMTTMGLSAYPYLPVPVRVSLQVTNEPIKNGTGGPQRSPMVVPSVVFDGNAISFPDYYQQSEFQIWQNGVLLYSVYIPEGTSEISLPDGLCGEIEIRFCTEEHALIGQIELEADE